MTSPAKVTAVIRSKDREHTITTAIQSVLAQTVPTDVVVVDSGSCDRTVEVAMSLGSRVVHIAPGEFTYGGAINAGVRLADSDFILVISAHCELPDETWLARALGHFEDPRVAGLNGVSSHIDADAVLTREQPELAVELALVDGVAIQAETWAGFSGFSNHASLLRRSVALTHPFDETMVACEDKEWANRTVAAGHHIAYVADLAVSGLHRRREGLRALYRRARKESQALSEVTGQPAWSARAAAAFGARVFRARRGVRRFAPWRPVNLVESAGRLAGAKRTGRDPGANELSTQLAAGLGPHLRGRVDLANFPLHNNCGDSAIWLGQSKLLSSLGQQTSGLRTFTNVLGRFGVHDPAPTIMVRGGGYFGDVWPTEFASIIDACDVFEGRHLVLGPQTVGRLSTGVIHEAQAAFARMSGVTFAVRDARSLELVQQHFPDVTALLLPDTASCLSRQELERLGGGRPPNDARVRVVARNDAEGDSSLHQAAVARGLVVHDFVDGDDDWLNTAVRWCHELVRVRAPRPVAALVLGRVVPRTGVHGVHARREVRRAVRILMGAEVVITDRLHAAVLSSVLGIRVAAVDTGYGKLTGYFTAWPSPNVELFASAESAMDAHGHP